MACAAPSSTIALTIAIVARVGGKQDFERQFGQSHLGRGPEHRRGVEKRDSAEAGLDLQRSRVTLRAVGRALRDAGGLRARPPPASDGDSDISKWQKE